MYNNLDFFEFLLVGIGLGCLVAICCAYAYQRAEEHRQRGGMSLSSASWKKGIVIPLLITRDSVQVLSSMPAKHVLWTLRLMVRDCPRQHQSRLLNRLTLRHLAGRQTMHQMPSPKHSKTRCSTHQALQRLSQSRPSRIPMIRNARLVARHSQVSKLEAFCDQPAPIIKT